MTTQDDSASPLDITVRARFEAWIDRRGVWPRLTYEEIWNAATIYERERICTSIKEEDDYCAGGDYMLDSNDCIKVACGEWIRADWGDPNAIYRDKPCSITSPDQPSKQPLPHASRA